MYISKRVFLTIITLFIVIFFLFMSLTIYGNILADDDFVNEHASQEVVDTLSNALNAEGININSSDSSNSLLESVIPNDVISSKPRNVAIILPSGDVKVQETVQLWCSLYKYRYELFSYWPEASEIKGFDILICDGIPETSYDINKFSDVCESGVDIVITQLQDIKPLSDSSVLRNSLGIRRIVSKEYEIDGVHLFGDFYLCNDRLYHDDDDYGEKDDMHLTIPYFTLRPGYEVYAVAILDDQDELNIDNEEMPPLLWRTVTGNSNVFVINSNVFSDNALLGTLTAFISRTSRTFVYPVANAQANCIINYPWLMAENNDMLSELYGHRADTLSWSVLWPSVVQTIYNYNQTADFYVSAQTDYSIEAEDSNDMASYAIKQIRKLLGTMGLSLKQTSDQELDDVLECNSKFFNEVVPKWRFSSVYCGDFEPHDLEPHLSDKNGILGDVSMVLYDRENGDPLISSLNDNVLLLGLTSYGFSHEAVDDIELISNETALALDLQYIDIDRVLYPNNDEDYWNKLSIKWASGITYYNDFKQFDFVLADELERRIRKLISCNYDYYETENQLKISINKSSNDEPAYFVIRMFNSIPDSISGGKLIKLSDTSYILEAYENEVIITEENMYKLESP